MNFPPKLLLACDGFTERSEEACAMNADSHCRFFEMVNTITEEKGRGTEDGDCEGDSLEVRTGINCVLQMNEPLKTNFKGMGRDEILHQGMR